MSSTLISFLVLAATSPLWVRIARALHGEVRGVLHGDQARAPSATSPEPRGLVHVPRDAAVGRPWETGYASSRRLGRVRRIANRRGF